MYSLIKAGSYIKVSKVVLMLDIKEVITSQHLEFLAVNCPRPGPKAFP